MIPYDSPVGDIAHAQDSQDSVPAACAAWAAWYYQVLLYATKRHKTQVQISFLFVHVKSCQSQ